MLGGVLALAQKNLAHFLLAALLVAAGLRSARALPLVALVLLPIANGAITKALADCSGLRPSIRRAARRLSALFRAPAPIDCA